MLWTLHVSPNHEVVLIEDDGGVRQAIGRILHGSGYEVDAYDSAEALLEDLRGEALWSSCRCLVCDVRLPGVSGFELHRLLCEQGPVPARMADRTAAAPAAGTGLRTRRRSRRVKGRRVVRRR